MKMRIILAAALASCMGFTINAQATLVVDFNDAALQTGTALPAVYEGFNWGGTWTVKADTTGNKYVQPATEQVTITRVDGATFNFDWADFSATLRGASVTITGYHDGIQVDSLKLALLNAWTTFRPEKTPPLFEGVDSLVFQGRYWRMDNFADKVVVPVPEPTTLIAGALLLLPFGVSTLRILRKKRSA